jgi:preprotein translocase subunit SecE
MSMNKIIQFFKEAFGELKKVSWPTRKEVWESTQVVVASVLIISVFLGLVDVLFGFLIKLVIK